MYFLPYIPGVFVVLFLSCGSDFWGGVLSIVFVFLRYCPRPPPTVKRHHRYIWETRIRDNSHLGVVDVSCQPAKAKIGKRKPSLLVPQQKEDVSSHIAQQQQHFQRAQYMQVRSIGYSKDCYVLCSYERTRVL